MTNLFASADFLNPENCRGYGPLPIPHPKDEQIRDLLRRWSQMDAEARVQSAQQLSVGQARALMAYSERMASQAVRTRDEDDLYFGLLALGLDGWRPDWRDNVLVLSLHYDAAGRLGIAPETIFKEASTFLSPAVAQGLRQFLARPEDARSLKAMGYVVDKDDDGFRYKRTW